MTDQAKASPENALAADWATIWQSEWAAVAVDLEMHEAWQQMAAAWAMRADANRQSPTHADAAPQSTRPAAPTRPSAAADAPDARDAAIASLLDRVAELERRVAKPAAELAAKPAVDPAQC